MNDVENTRFLCPHGLVPLPKESPRGVDLLRRHFNLPAATVTFSLRHFNRDKVEISTPPSVENCFEVLQRYFEPHISAAAVCNTCFPGSRLHLRFNKLTSSSSSSEAPLLNVYVYAVDQSESRPRVLHNAVREWQGVANMAVEGSCLVMLYHQDLVDATSTSAMQAAVFGGEVKMPDQRKAEAAASSLWPYFDELSAMKLGPQQMCSYMPNEAPTRIVERLSAAYRSLTKQLTNVFNASQQRKSTHRLSGERSSNSVQTSAWSLHKCWRSGYDLAVHYLQFGMVSKAMAIFARMYDVYYYHSDDHTFLKKRESIEQLIKLPDLFRPASFPVHHQGKYPLVLQDSAEPGVGLLFIVVCEMQCALLLERRDLAFARFSSFLQLSREKFTEERTPTEMTDPWQIVFLFHFSTSAMRTNWVPGAATDGHAGVRVDGSETPSSDRLQSSEFSQRNPPPSQHLQSFAEVSSPLLTEPLRGTEQTIGSFSASVHSGDSSTLIPWPDAEIEIENDVVRCASEAASTADVTRRLGGLCKTLKVEWVEKTVQGDNERLFIHLADEVLELASDLGTLLGYSEAGEVVKENIGTTFGLEEVDSIDAFVTFYQTLTEAAALYCRLLNYRHREYALLYKLARSFIIKEPSKTAKLCQLHLIPFVNQRGWKQLQIIVYNLLIDATGRVMRQRQGQAKELQRLVFSDEEAHSMKASLLCLIAAFNEHEPLKSEVKALVGKQRDPKALWLHIKSLMMDEAIIKSSTAKRSDQQYTNGSECDAGDNAVVLSYLNLFDLLRNVRTMCLRDKPAFGEENRAKPYFVSRDESFPDELQLDVGETLYLYFEAHCPVDLLACSGKNDEVKDSQDKLLSEPLAPTATLVSRRDWCDEDEIPHVVDVVTVWSTVYSEEERLLQWVWELRACHAGKYYLHEVALQVGTTKLVYQHSVASSPLSVKTFLSSRVMGSTPRICGWISNGTNAANTGSLVTVREPDLGVKVQLGELEESHCFGDSLTLFEVAIEMKNALHFVRSEEASGEDVTTDRRRKVDSTGVSKNKCRFESLNTRMPPSVGVGVSGECRTRTVRYADCRSTLDNTAASTVMSGPVDSCTLACLFLTRPKNCPPLRVVKCCVSLLQSLTRPARNEVKQLLSDVIAWVVESDEQRDGSLIVASIKHNNGAFTTVPINEGFVMSRLPPVTSNVTKRSDDENSNCSDVRNARSVLPLQLDGSILPYLKQQSCFRICLDDQAEKCHMMQQLEEETNGRKSDSNHFAHTNNLRLSLPLLPLYMTVSEEQAHLSFCYEGDSDSSSGSSRVSAPIPYAMAAAFAVHYSFKCCQGRVYCLVRAKNVLRKTSVWLRGALLELVDGDRYYELVRVSSALEHLMTREWRAGESVHLFFELAPSSTAPHQANGRRHTVRVQLIYSRWSTAQELKPMEEHILHPSGVKGDMFLLPTTKDVRSLGEVNNSGSCVIRCNDDAAAGGFVESLNAAVDSELAGVATGTRLHYDVHQLEKLYSSCNTFNGPPATFTAKHSCLFIAKIVAQSHAWGATGFNTNSVPNAVEGVEQPSLGADVLVPGVSGDNFLSDCVFPLGEPVQFIVTLEPLAHNWPESSFREEEFIIDFKVETAFWFVVGKRKLRRKLSLMESTTVHFMAVPLPLDTSGTGAEVSVDNRLHEYETFGNMRKGDDDGMASEVFNAPTPTVELRFVSSGNYGDDSLVDRNNNLAVEVIHFSALMRIEKRQ